jgi:hypothetical protein
MVHQSRMCHVPHSRQSTTGTACPLCAVRALCTAHAWASGWQVRPLALRLSKRRERTSAAMNLSPDFAVEIQPRAVWEGIPNEWPNVFARAGRPVKPLTGSDRVPIDRPNRPITAPNERECSASVHCAATSASLGKLMYGGMFAPVTTHRTCVYGMLSQHPRCTSTPANHQPPNRIAISLRCDL